ncbi:MAG: ribosome biogenesis/translation initiation ATPase RLI [Candidatus Micrarchaeota archaeon]
MRIAIIDRDKCTKEKCGYLCMKVCPGVRMGEETVIVDKETGFPIISESLCTGCGICVKRCPVGAIKIINLAHEAGTLVHQYGVNSFRLFNLPLPKEKSVVGLIGSNGIGKSTAIKILGNKISPNMGDYDGETKWSDVLDRFKGKELYNYFLSLKKGVKVSYKPQNVDIIPEVFPGTVESLLRKNDERGVFDDAIGLFGLRDCLGKNLPELSGGELQRVAICATFLRDADVYYFDEPTSYLDIEQRLSVAKHIKELSKEKRVVLVEHDLAVLDYLSDYIHVFYGIAGAYGVVSGIKVARNGVNEYLDGYMKEENVRFRNYGIKFFSGAVEMVGGKTAFAYPALSKTYPRFELKCEGGEARSGEIVGILGPNAIGKTTFVKMIAGIEKPDSGEAKFDLRISYKPQYIKQDFEGTVADYMDAADINKEVFNAEVSAGLDIRTLMDKDVRNLSGGELQRVAIGACIARDSDIYLLDEPSAFLDIEQRLRFSSVIRRLIERNEKTAFVVDHDVVLLDSVSDRMIVFDGESGESGNAGKPLDKRAGMNAFLKRMGVTMRRDKDSLRPRINKPDSKLDREMRERGEYYYS